MKYNNSQIEAIQHVDGPMLVLAGPGSGKTAVITQRTYNLIHKHNIEPSSILVITFTKAAANEMKNRFLAMSQADTTRVTFGTFHAIFFMVLKYAYGMSSSNIISEEQRYGIMRDILSYHRLEYKDENEFIGNLLGEIGKIKNSRIDINNFYSSVCGEEVFRKIFKEYQSRLKDSRLIDFDDMLTYTFELFSERKDILGAWQKKYKYILIDEFQDINQIQYDIIRMMALPDNNLFIVGDDDQSIYRFRGSKPEIMLNFNKDYPDAKQVLLDTNYRSGRYIVETSLNLISNNKERFNKKIKANKSDDTPVKYLTFESRKEENLYIIKAIDDLLKKGVEINDIAILCRTNLQPRLLIEQLMKYNIPFKTRDSIPNIYEHWIARDLFTYMRLAAGGRARRDFLQIMNRPKRYIGRDSLCDPEVAFDEWIQIYEEQPWIAERIERLEYDLKMLSRMNPFAAINYIRRGIGYDDFLKEYAEYRSISYEDLLDTIEEIQAGSKGYKTFDEWQEHIKDYSFKLKKLAEMKKENPDAVTLSTLHSSKGLEYEAVFITDCNEGIMPYKKAVLEKDIEEERRLFYVGMTRAKRSLCLCGVKSINDKKSELSRFLLESKQSQGK